MGVAGGLSGFAAALFAGHVELAWSCFTFALLVFCLTTRLSLHWQILIGTLIGVAFGLWLGEAADAMRNVGMLFIGLLKMLIAPLILLTIVHGVASMGEARQIGRLGSRTVALYLLTMVLAVGTGLVLVNLVEPGVGSELANSEFFRDAVGSDARAAEGPPPIGVFLLETANQLVENPVAALAAGHILPIVAFAILLGLALARLGPRASAVTEFLSGASSAVLMIIGWFVRLAPVGVFALVGNLVATIGFRIVVENLFAFSLVVIGGTLFHSLVVLPAMAWFMAGLSPIALFRGIFEAMVVAFTTSSSAASLPVTIRCVEEGLGVPRHISSFVLPLGATMNSDGTALYEAIAAVFIANVLGFELGLGGQIVVFIVSIATAIGAPGIPSAGMVTMVVVLEAVGLPGEAVGILLTIDRFLDTFRTVANVEGDAVVAAIVARQLG
ncbi:MAG: dicarboxylate/amino acid:cation symporter [Myxococcota bacterium]